MYMYVYIACHSIQAHTNRHTDTYVVLTEMGYTSCKQTDRHTHTHSDADGAYSEQDRQMHRQTDLVVSQETFYRQKL